MRIAHAIFFLMFLLSIVVQYNDPDGVLWMLLYATPAAITAAAFFQHLSPLALPLALAYTITSFIWMPWDHISHLGEYVSEVHMSSPESEYSRESLGLLIGAVWMYAISVGWWRNRSVKQH